MARNKGRRNSSLSSLGSQEPENVVTRQSASGEFAQVSGVAEPEASSPEMTATPPVEVPSEPESSTPEIATTSPVEASTLPVSPTPETKPEVVATTPSASDLLSGVSGEEPVVPESPKNEEAATPPVQNSRPASPGRTLPPRPAPAPRELTAKQQYNNIIDKISNPREDNLLSEEDVKKLKSLIEENRDNPDFANWSGEHPDLSTALLEIIRMNEFTPKEVGTIGDHLIGALGNNEQAKAESLEKIHAIFKGDEHSKPFSMSPTLKNVLGIESKPEVKADDKAPEAATQAQAVAAPDAATAVKPSAEDSLSGNNGEQPEPGPNSDRRLTNTASALRDVFEQRVHETACNAKLAEKQMADEDEARRLQSSRGEQSSPRGFFGTIADGIASRLQSGPRTKSQVAAAIELQTRLGSAVATRARAQIEESLVSSKERLHRMEARRVEAQRIQEEFINIQKELSNKSKAAFQDPDYLGKKIAELSSKGEALAFEEPTVQKAVDEYMQRQNELTGGLTSLVQDSIEDRKEAIDNMSMYNSKVEFLDKANLISDEEKTLLSKGGDELTEELGAIQGIAEDTGLTGPKEQEESLKQKMRETVEKLQKMLQKLIQRIFGGPSHSGPSMG